MHGRSILLLGVIAAALVGVFVYQRRATTGPEPEVVVPLVPGFEPTRLHALRIDHRIKGAQLRIENDADGRWRIVDPLRDAEADLAVVGSLVDLAREGRGVLNRWDDVPGASATGDARAEALRRLGLDPPRARVELFERAEGASAGAASAERRHELLLGSLDIDGSGVWVLADGRLLHTSRALDSLLDRSLNDYRSRRAVEIDPNEVLGITRSGPLGVIGAPLTTPGAAFEIELAGAEPAAGTGTDANNGVSAAGTDASSIHWRLRAPYVLRLDPLGASALLRAACVLPVLAFVDDHPTDLARYGLAQPRLSIALRLRGGTVRVLDFGRYPDAPPEPPNAGDWLCIERGGGTVWRVEPRDVAVLAAPLEGLLDYRITRAERDAITWIEIACAGAASGDGASAGTRVELRASGGKWWLGEPGVAPRADDGRVADLLGALERSELHAYVPDAAFDARGAGASLTLRAGDAIASAFHFGAAHEHAGTRGVLALRDGDSLPALAPAELTALLVCASAPWRGREVWKIDELTVSALEVRGDGCARRFVRDDRDGRWLRDGQNAAVAKQLEPLWLERLLSVQVQAWLDEPSIAGATSSAAPHELTRRVDVRWTLKDGKTLELALGLDAEGKVELRRGSARARPRFAELHAALLALCAAQ